MLGGVLCRILAYTSLAFNTFNSVTVEVSTPAFVDPEGLLFCVATPNVNFSITSISLSSLDVGGNQFTDAAQNVLNTQTTSVSLDGVSFFQVKTSLWQLDALEFGTLYDVLANDDYYASSYQRQRYDDLQSASGSVDLVSTDGSGEGSPNCVLLTANWIAGTRYQLDFNMTNPTGGRGSEASDLSFWFAPLTYARIDENHLQHTVRGSKAGQVCVEGTSLQNYGKELFDACEVVSSQLTKQLSGEDVCLSELRNHYQADSFPWSDEYSGRVNVHKSATGLGISAQAVTNSTCGANEAFSSHFGGECIDCGTGEVQYSENTQQPLSCVCPTDRIQNLIGSPACGGPKSVIEEANTTRQVANSLCAFYSQKYDGLLSQQTSALSVIHTYIEDFQDQAHLLLDIDEMSRINKTFVDKYMFDERLEKSPTRKSGIHPNCYKCDTVETQQNGQIVGVSMFKDFNSGALGEVQDVFFQAVHTFRLIGFALHSLGYSCDYLFSMENPFKKAYGTFTTEICQQL